MYNLKADPSEQHDLTASMLDKAAAMYRTLQAWQAETGAAIPRLANPAYDPKADRPHGGPQGTGGGKQRGKMKKNS